MVTEQGKERAADYLALMRTFEMVRLNELSYCSMERAFASPVFLTATVGRRQRDRYGRDEGHPHTVSSSYAVSFAG